MRLAKITAALVVAGLALPAQAAGPDAATLQKLVERMEKLEARNADLEKQVKSLKGESDEIAKGLDSPRLSETEPELTVRLKAVEKDALGMKKAAKIEKGSGKPHLEKVGKVTRAQLEEIAKTKKKDLTAADMDAAVKTIAGSARSMGITVEGV